VNAEQVSELGSTLGVLAAQWLILALIAWAGFSVVLLVRFFVLLAHEYRSDMRHEIATAAPHDRL